MDDPEQARLVAEEIARRGEEIYRRDICAEVEPEHNGKFLVVDVESGDYALGETDDEAFDRVEERNPGGLFYLMRIGRKAAHRIGDARLRPAPPSASW